MNMEVLTGIPFELDATALMRDAHIESGSEDAVEFTRLLSRVREVASPKAVYGEAFIEERGEETITLDGITFRSRALRRNLENAERVFPYVASCGAEIDGLLSPADDFMVPFWLDAVKASLLGAAMRHLNAHLDDVFRLGKTGSMSPGSGDATVWPIEQQRELFALLGPVEKAIGVRLTESCLMIPNKTVSGIRFRTETDFRTCQVCRREKCPSRSAPLDQNLWDEVHAGRAGEA